MRERWYHSRPVATFLLLVGGLSAVCDAALIRSGTIRGASGLYALALMWSPAIAALLAARLQRGWHQDLGWRLGSPRYLVLAYLFPVAYAGLAYGTVWLGGLGRFVGPWPAHLPVVLVAGTIAGSLSALGEELGWRGFLVPHLAARYGFAGAALLSGAIWAVWHLPVLLFTDYGTSSPRWYGFACFVIGIVGLSFALAWFRLKSGSVWPAVLLHAAHNLYVLNLFAPVTVEPRSQFPLTGEDGAMMVIVGLLAGGLFWALRARLPLPEKIGRADLGEQRRASIAADGLSAEALGR
jgi:membrane protease YdiL (CAAX protease family)